MVFFAITVDTGSKQIPDTGINIWNTAILDYPQLNVDMNDIYKKKYDTLHNLSCPINNKKITHKYIDKSLRIMIPVLFYDIIAKTQQHVIVIQVYWLVLL